MKTVFQEAYQYILVQDGEEWYLTFFTGGPMVVDICVKLTQEEIDRVSNSKEETSRLAKEFLRDRSLFEGRRIIPSVVG